MKVGDAVRIEYNEETIYAIIYWVPENSGEFWQFRNINTGELFTININHSAYIGTFVTRRKEDLIWEDGRPVNYT
jgi:hypothetical protein